MHISLALPVDRSDRPDEFLTGEAIGRLAAAAERAGFHAVTVIDHPFPDEAWLRSGGYHAMDPTVVLSFAAAATSRLRLRTNLFVLPYRNPFLAAKAFASLDVLSGGRVDVGVGTGYLEHEFAALGATFADRNEAMDEAIVAMRRAWTEDAVEAESPRFRAVGNTMAPRPRQQPHPPIWVGGNSRRAIRRAVELADGWIPFINPAGAARQRRTAAIESIDDLRRRLDDARVQATEVGRVRPLRVMLYPFAPIRTPGPDESTDDAQVATARALAGIGVTEVGTRIGPFASCVDMVTEIERLGSAVVPRIAEIAPGAGVVAEAG